MDPLARNERLKLTANALDRASTSFLTIGVLAPVAASIYGMGPAIPSLPIVIASGIVWLLCAFILHWTARVLLKGLRS